MTSNVYGFFASDDDLPLVTTDGLIAAGVRSVTNGFRGSNRFMMTDRVAQRTFDNLCRRVLDLEQELGRRLMAARAELHNTAADPWARVELTTPMDPS